MDLAKLLENFKLALVCCSDEWRGWVSNNSPSSESCTSTSLFHPLELTGIRVTVAHAREETKGVQLYKAKETFLLNFLSYMIIMKIILYMDPGWGS